MTAEAAYGFGIGRFSVVARLTAELFAMLLVGEAYRSLFSLCLVDDDDIRQALMRSEPGDHIRLKGMLVEYSNPANGFRRGTSTTRTDTGNGACETIYVEDFEVIRKANHGVRMFYTVALWTTLLSCIGVLVLFVLTPHRVT